MPSESSRDEPRPGGDVEPGVVVFSPYCTDFHPGVIDARPTTDCDCNANGVRDVCECPADVVGNCDVGFADVLSVLARWGPCFGCPQDVNRDGHVDAIDVNDILATWGPCGG